MSEPRCALGWECETCPFRNWDCDTPIRLSIILDNGVEVPLNDAAIEAARELDPPDGWDARQAGGM